MCIRDRSNTVPGTRYQVLQCGKDHVGPVPNLRLLGIVTRPPVFYTYSISQQLLSPFLYFLFFNFPLYATTKLIKSKERRISPKTGLEAPKTPVGSKKCRPKPPIGDALGSLHGIDSRVQVGSGSLDSSCSQPVTKAAASSQLCPMLRFSRQHPSCPFS